LVADSLVYRYDVSRSSDGIKGDEGTFNICTFWLVEAQVRAAGRTDAQRLRDARLIFEQMLGYANHLGLYSEETGPTGEALGNFPQAFTHLGLLNSTLYLAHAEGQPLPVPPLIGTPEHRREGSAPGGGPSQTDRGALDGG
jgi:GH15 family glucan-1,4-alpha-glucosidase